MLKQRKRLLVVLYNQYRLVGIFDLHGVSSDKEYLKASTDFAKAVAKGRKSLLIYSLIKVAHQSKLVT